MEFILGSASPRRREILRDFFDPLKIVHPSIDESVDPGETPESFVSRITREKMRSVISQINAPGKFTAVTSDTIVTIDNLILGKPESIENAAEMLSLLSGREHRVLTGLSVYTGDARAGIELTGLESTSVFFRKLDRAAISDYLKLVDYSDKAGSYAIQENGDMLVESINGSITNIIGFPLRLFFSLLQKGDLTSLLLSE